MTLSLPLRPCALALALLASACVRPTQPPPAPPPVSRPAPPVPVPAPRPVAADWRDRALTPGDWSYRVHNGIAAATFADDRPRFSVRCDRARRMIILARPEQPAANATLTLRATDGAASYPLVAGTGEMTATVPSGDAQLDRIAFSRGRFMVQVTGSDDLILPAWAEVARVIEDCRG